MSAILKRFGTSALSLNLRQRLNLGVKRTQLLHQTDSSLSLKNLPKRFHQHQQHVVAQGNQTSVDLGHLLHGQFAKQECANFAVIVPSLVQVYNVQRRSFHTSPRRPIHPLVWMLLRPLGQIGAIISGRYFRKWWQALPEDDKHSMKRRFGFTRLRLMAAVALLMTASVVNYYFHIQETPLTGRKRFIAFTPEQFQKIMLFEFEMQWASLEQSVVPLSHPAYKKIVEVADCIVKGNQDLEFFRQQTWTVIVIDSDDENAFVLPTGHIFVFTGLLKAVQNDDQLAVVLGHEMAHAVLGHGAEQVSFAQMMDLYIVIVMAAIWAFIPSDGIALVTQWFYKKVIDILLHLPYNRKLEREADEIGLQLIAKACYDVRESSSFWNMMAIRSDSNEDTTPPEFLSTHPAHEARAQLLDEMLPKAIEIRQQCHCGKLPAKDPRTQVQMLRTMMAEAQGDMESTTAKQPDVIGAALPSRIPVVAHAS